MKKGFLPSPAQFFLLFILCLSIESLQSFDLFWHLAAGREIFQQKGMIYKDIFSFTRFGKEWTYHEPFFGLLVYSIYHFFGYPALLFLKSLLITLPVSLLLVVFRRKGSLLVILCAALWILLSGHTFTLRPHLLSFSFFILQLFLLLRLIDETSPARIFLPGIFLSLLMMVWTNTHASFILGVLVLFLAVLTLSLTGRLKSWNSALLLVAILCPAINPHGFMLYTYPFEYVGKTIHSTYLEEWFPPTFKRYPAFYLVIAILALKYTILFFRGRGLFNSLGTRQRVIFLLLVQSLCLYFAFTSARHIPFFGIAAVFSLVLLQDGLFRSGRWTNVFKRQSPLQGILFVIIGIFTAFVISLSRPPLQTDLFPSPGLIYRISTRPETNLFSKYRLGGYLIWTLGPEKKVFIDGRADLYGEEIFLHYMQLYYFGPRFDSILEKFPIDALLLPENSPLLPAMREYTLFSDGGYYYILPGSHESPF